MTAKSYKSSYTGSIVDGVVRDALNSDLKTKYKNIIEYDVNTDTDLNRAIQAKLLLKEVELSSDGENYILTYDGDTLTYETLYALVTDSANYVCVINGKNILIPYEIDTEGIGFGKVITTTSSTLFAKVTMDVNSLVRYNTVTLESQSNKTKVIDLASTDEQYPTAKAVYTAVANKNSKTELNYAIGSSGEEQIVLKGVAQSFSQVQLLIADDVKYTYLTDEASIYTLSYADNDIIYFDYVSIDDEGEVEVNKIYIQSSNAVGKVAFKTELLQNKVTILDDTGTDIQYPTAKAVYDSVVTKQEKLVSGVSIKTINGVNLLGSGNIVIEGGGSGGQALWGSIGGNIGDQTDLKEALEDTTKVTFRVWGEDE